MRREQTSFPDSTPTLRVLCFVHDRSKSRVYTRSFLHIFWGGYFYQGENKKWLNGGLGLSFDSSYSQKGREWEWLDLTDSRHLNTTHTDTGTKRETHAHGKCPDNWEAPLGWEEDTARTKASFGVVDNSIVLLFGKREDLFLSLL